MKVIKKGSENTEFGKNFTCVGSGFGKGKGGCGAVLHLVPADVFVSHYDGDSSYSFVCPECSATTYISYDAFSK